MPGVRAILCVILVASTIVPGLAQQVTLVDGGEPAATIVIPDEPLASEKFAAEELRSYLSKMSGADLSVVADSERPAGTVITVGATTDVPPDLRADLAVEECVIRTLPDRLMIVGGRAEPAIDSSGRKWVQDRGTLYGVYEFLHMLGVRWYDPSPIGEVVPDRPTITVTSIDYRHAPPFPYRAGFGGIWAVRNRYSGNAWGGEEWGGIWYEWTSHMYQYAVPPDRYFEDKPEWFPLIGGKRVKEGQLCISNPEVVDRFVEFVLSSYKNNPQLRVMGIEANDGHGWCECEQCRALDQPDLVTPYKNVSMSPRVMDFNVNVAKRVAEQNPDAVVGWYIYSDHTEVPAGLTSLPDNLHGRFCTYASSYSDYSQPIETGTSPQNARSREAIQGWRELLKHLSTYEYWSGYQWFGPMPIRKTIAANIRYYHKLGLEGCYQLGPRHWGSQGFNYWLAGRLLWDPSQSEDDLLDDYCEGFFGPAGDLVKQYHLRLEKAVADSGIPVMSGGAYIEPIFTAEVLADAESLLDQAIQRADTDVVRARVKRLQQGVRFTRMAVAMSRAEKAGAYDEALAVGRELIAWLNDVHPAKADLKARIEGAAGEIGKLAEDSDFGAAATASRELREWLGGLAEGQWVFAALDSEPGGHLNSRINKLAQSVKDFGRIMAVADVVCAVPAEWRFRKDPDRVGEEQGWFVADHDDLGWGMIPIAVWWENAGHPGYDGMAWYRTRVAIPRKFDGHAVQVFFGAVDGDAVVYVNGQKAGEHMLGEGGKGWDEAFSVDITDQVRLGAENQITVSVYADAAYGGIWKSVRIVSPRGDAVTQGKIRLPLEADDDTVLLLDFNEPVMGWMANEAYGEGAFPGQGEDNLAAWFNAPDQPRTGIRTGVGLPVEGTIECWVKPVGLQRGHATIFTVGTVGNTKLNGYLSADNRVRFTIVREGKTETVESQVALPDAQWTHVAMTWSEGPQRLYINGQLEAEGEGVGPPYHCGSDALLLGCQPWWVDNKGDHTAWYLDLNFAGSIDDFRVSRVARQTFDALGR